MPMYRRVLVPGGTYFFTLVTENRAPIFKNESARQLLHDAVAEAGRLRPFGFDAGILLHDHLHVMVTRPPGDADFPTRIASIKSSFTRAYLAAGGVEQPRSAARVRKRRRGVWQRWFWEHRVRDVDDRNVHLDYIHYNAVKHSLVQCPHAWKESSFHRYVREGFYEPDWQCVCYGRVWTPPRFDGLDTGEIEGDKIM